MGDYEMKSIAIIIPYFGSWPIWSDLFFYSCAKNDTIDFFFFTDNSNPICDNNNLHFFNMSFQSYCEIVRKKLKVNFRPDNPYKLCDLRPFFGFLHEDILIDYDFWGYGDVDLIWGDIREFYTEELLMNYNILSTHADRVSGHFALIKNLFEYNMLAFRIPNWRNLIEEKKHYALDEIQFTLLFYPQAKWLWKIHKHVFFNLEKEWEQYSKFLKLANTILGIDKHGLYFVEQDTTPWFSDEMVMDETIRQQRKWLYKDGKVYDVWRGKELIYLHFLSLKNYWPACGGYFNLQNNRFYNVSISLDGFFYIFDFTSVPLRLAETE